MGISGWTVFEKMNEYYTADIRLVTEKSLVPLRVKIDSWTQVPFVDAIVLDAEENILGCPDSHPDELIFELWPGTTGMCDCLQDWDN